MDKLRIGLLGAGGIASAHIWNLSMISECQITAICDINQESAANLAARITKSQCVGAEGAAAPEVAVYGDFDAMLASRSFDALYITLPPFAHSGQLEKAAANGLHVFVEKPIALSLDRAESMVAAVQKAGVVSQVGYQNRFGAAVRKLKQMIDDGMAGRPVLFDGRYACNSLHSPWWREKEKSGGQVFEQAIHIYDIAMTLFGPAIQVGGFASNLCHQAVERYTAEDVSAAILQFASGALATIAATNCAQPGQWLNPFTVVCEKVTVHFTDCNHAEFIYTGGGQENVKKEPCAQDVNVYLEEDKAFVEACMGRSAPQCTIEEGFGSLKMVDAVIRSAQQGGLVQLLR